MTLSEYVVGALILAVILSPLALEWWRRQPEAHPTPRDLDVEQRRRRFDG